jgi:hypothetical protein
LGAGQGWLGLTWHGTMPLASPEPARPLPAQFRSSRSRVGQLPASRIGTARPHFSPCRQPATVGQLRPFTGSAANGRPCQTGR